ncbi:unnamed protein product [Vicia faba]|uniref:Uncharacterized protein n=1 Tax=Vicia faba TaxID=3906 RepID=A0AAV1A559_VICFA|nr:unnamed protein product [Vicia faba]
MLASHRKITEVQAYEIDLADDSGLRHKSTFQLMSTHAGQRANVGLHESMLKIQYKKTEKGKEVEADLKLSRTQMFKHIVSKFIKVAVSYEEEDLKFVDDTVYLMFTDMLMTLPINFLYHH